MRHDEPLLSALRERVPPDASRRRRRRSRSLSRGSGSRFRHSCADIYGVANGGLGPGLGLLRIGEGEGTLIAVYRSFADSSLGPRQSSASRGSTSIRGPTACCRSATGDARFGRASTVAPMTARSSRPRTATRREHGSHVGVVALGVARRRRAVRGNVRAGTDASRHQPVHEAADRDQGKGQAEGDEVAVNIGPRSPRRRQFRRAAAPLRCACQKARQPHPSLGIVGPCGGVRSSG